MTLRKPAFRLTPLDLPLVLFVSSSALGIWPAYDRSLCIRTLIALVAGSLLYVLISRATISRRRWRIVALSIVLLCVLLSLYFIAQQGYLKYLKKVEALTALDALIRVIVPSSLVWFPLANSVATFLEGGLFLAVALVLTENKPLCRFGGAVGVGLIALALLMSGSLGTWTAVVSVSVLWAALYWRPARVVAFGGAILVLLLVIYVIMRGDITALSDIPLVDRTLAPAFIRPDRLEVYRNSVYLIQDFPLSGIGLGEQFAMVLSQYALLIQVPFLTYSHNLYLEVWLEQGLLGITAWLWLMAALYQAARTCARPKRDILYQSTWLGLTAILVHGISDARQYVDLWCWFPFFGLLGLNGAILLRRTSTAPQRRWWVFPAATIGMFLIVVTISLHPIQAALHTNLGCILQSRADLLEQVDNGQRTVLRQQAGDHYKRAIQIDPHRRTPRQRLGLLLMSTAQFQDAVEHLEVAWQADQKNTTTHKALGLAYVWVGELEKAQPLLQNVPNIVEELNVWGWWRGTQQQMEQSLNAYRMSLLLEPDQPQLREKLEQLEQ